MLRVALVGVPGPTPQEQAEFALGPTHGLPDGTILRGVSASALSPCADRNGGQAHRERNVGVRGCAVEMGADAQVSIHGTDALQYGSVIGEPSAGPRSDFLDLGRHLTAGCAIVLGF